ncbi:MAG TPA: hypothetical protein VHS75_11950 [Phenylobacterium sp.]|nr:hypothetical protein [Phenylobacterium sp.]HEX3365762.1 hypothetical protein [Phenylobacterium sp.]
MRVDTSQIALAQRDAVPIEEFEDLDGDLAAVVDAVAELRGGEGPAVRPSGLLKADGDHLPDCRAQEEVILRDLVGPTQSSGEFEQAPDVALLASGRVGQVADPRRPEPLRSAQARRDQGPGRLIAGRQPRRVALEPDKGPIQDQLARAGQPLQGGGEHLSRQPRLQLQAQLFPA